MDVSVIVPTYREALNIPELVPRVAKALTEAGLAFEIVIVDDDSPDDTERVCAELAKTHPLRLCVRKNERGLSSAVVHGMRQAKGDVLLCMDADLSHPPEKVPDLVRALDRVEVDFVIGSRYVEGGTTDETWGILRKINSKGATALAWPLTSAKDPMAGFFALRRRDFESAAKLDPVGYKIGLELIVKAGCRRIHEVPIHFSDRLHGSSKMSFKEQLNYLRHLRRLYQFRYPSMARLLQFLAVGSTGVVVDLSAFALLLFLALPLSIARAAAIWVAMSWNFLLNRRITFSYARRDSAARQYVLFCLSCLVGAVVNWSVSIGLVTTVDFFEKWKVLAAFCGVVAGTAFNYLLSVRVVFRTSEDSALPVAVPQTDELPVAEAPPPAAAPVARRVESTAGD